MRRSNISLAISCGMIFIAASSMAELLVQDDFEGLPVDWGRQTGAPANILVVDTSLARLGTKALRIQIHKDDPWVANGPRSEMLHPKSIGLWDEGGDYWVTGSVLFPQDYEDDPAQEIFWQVHAIERPEGAEDGGMVPFYMQSIDDKILIRGKGFDTITIEKTKGQWMDFIVHHRWSSQGNGVTQVYVDGEMLVDEQDSTNMFADDRLYWKFGLYKSGWRSGTEADSSVSQRELWFDDVRISTTASPLPPMLSTLK